MIPRRYIEEWKAVAPWPNDAQVEQDLVIARTLVEIFSDDLLKKSLAFRGGTAYQRRKGRDLFDLYWAMIHQDVNTEKLISCYKTYMEYSVGKPPSQKQFLTNMEEKLLDREFMEDIHAILRPGAEYNNDKAWELVKKRLVERV